MFSWDIDFLPRDFFRARGVPLRLEIQTGSKIRVDFDIYNSGVRVGLHFGSKKTIYREIQSILKRSEALGER